MRRSVAKIQYPGLDFSKAGCIRRKTVWNLLRNYYRGCARKKREDLDSDGIEIIKNLSQHNAKCAQSLLSIVVLSIIVFVLCRNYI